MNQHTPAQIKVIQTWTEQRDTLLREIGILSTQLESLKKETKEEGLALADLHKSIAEARGRIAELVALEDRYKGSLSTEVAELLTRKSKLESECATKEADLKTATEKYQVTTNAIVDLSKAHDVMKDQAVIVNKVTGELIETSQLHISNLKNSIGEIQTIADQIIEKGNANIAQTNIVLEKLPRYIFELQKPIPVRRVYKAPAGTVIAPEGEQI